MAKFSELWSEIEKLLAQGATGNRLAVIEAHKVLEAVLETKGYPGKTLEEKLFWAGYSGKDKEGISEAIERRNDIVEMIDYQFSDFEAQEAVRMYKKVAESIVSKPELKFSDKIKVFSEIYFSPKSIKFWLYVGIFIGTFVIIKLLSSTELGGNIVDAIVNLSNLIVSWIFVVFVFVIIALILGVNAYFSNRSKIKIKE